MGERRRNFIAHWRKYKGVTADQLIDRLVEYGDMHGITLPSHRVSLSRIERGQQNFSIDFLDAVAAVLATGEDDPTAADLITTNPFAGALDATRMLESMSDRQRRIAQGVLAAMLAEDKKEYRADDPQAQ